MTLQALPGGSQRFVLPAMQIAPDIRNLTNPETSAPLAQGLTAPDYIKPVQIKGTPYWYGKVTFHSARGPVKQEGYLAKDHESRASGSAVCDNPDVLRLPIVTNAQTSPDPAATPFRMTHERFGGKELIGMWLAGTTVIYQETSTTSPTIIAVPSFTARSNTLLNDMHVAEFSGISYLLLCYGGWGAVGGTTTLQAIADITNPTVDSFVATAGNAVYGVQKLPDGTLMIYYALGAGGGRIGISDITAATPATATISDTSYITPGGYIVGLHSLGGGAPQVFIAVPQTATGAVTFSPGNPVTLRCDLLAVSLDGYTIQKVETGLPWSTFHTPVRDGLMNCDGSTHIFTNGRRREPMNWLNGRPPSPIRNIICRGHHTDGVRFWWKANYIASGVATEAWWEEYDFDNNVSLPCSLPVVMGVDTQSVGGWDLPYSSNTRNLHDYMDGSWHHQTQRIPRVDGYDLRRLPNGTAGIGEEYEAADGVTWPILEYPGLEGCPQTTIRITGPHNRHILQGQNATFDGTTRAVVSVSEAQSNINASFHARGPDDRRPSRSFPLNRSWGYGIKPGVQMARQTGGTDPTRLTPNGFPVTYEMIFYKDGIGNIVPAQYRYLDATRFLQANA